ncbi:cyclic nucleotide-binding domain-containing protein [Haliangium ochraceum]|uniref:Cyclic nucleotide-binding protein n=1 Tax=Haliangium ochraceum (strain DSM 14365 / JCM 11303 / SMP-2) TaxID=502025 RepID=D0LZ68_HALO1|nr:cyclic nucleotide-binding domain-containing protein [Haliangium ochraceum]ACY16330.1 cyclic nucleotide-binding protein [Haliangium ochraceum DSM 14365]
MELSFAAATDVGKQRDHNEDNFLIDKRLRLFVVADGMGGHAGGEVASSIAVHEIRDAVYENRDVLERFRNDESGTDAVEILQILEHAIQTACASVHSQAQADASKRGMGTTASVLLIAGPPTHLRGFIAHVGDSRIYLARQSQCHQLTEDHSLVNELIRRGKLKRGELDSSPYKQYKNAVTRAVGIYPSVEVDTFDFDILPGDRLLICSDGLYGYLDEEQLPKQLTSGDVKEVPSRLIDIANNGGGHDNITGVVIRVGESPAHEVGQRAQELSLKLEVLKSMRMFRYLSYKELVRVMNITETRGFANEEAIFREGDPGDAMFVVLSGTVRLFKADVPVALMKRGHHFGEMSLVDRSVRSLTAVAEEESRLIAIPRQSFYSIVKKEPALAVKILWSFVQVLGNRLRKTTADLSDALHHQAERPGSDGGKPDEPFPG